MPEVCRRRSVFSQMGARDLSSVLRHTVCRQCLPGAQWPRTMASPPCAGSRSLLGAGKRPRPFLLDLFSGARGPVGRAIRRRGWDVLAYDLVVQGDEGDLTNQAVKRSIAGKIQRGDARAAMVAPPCSSFTVAWNRVWEARPSHLPWGSFENLALADQVKVLNGNATLRAALFFIRVLESKRCPWMLEQPTTSRMWLIPQVAELQRKPHVTMYFLDQCGWGAPWRKATSILCSRIAPEHAVRLCRTCTSSGGGVCGFSQKCHIRLSGGDPSTGQAMTRTAARYPRELANWLGFLLTDAVSDEAPLSLSTSQRGRGAELQGCQGSTPHNRGVSF